MLVGSWGCGEAPSSAGEEALDAGPTCARGTDNCACISGSGCQAGLLCIAGRCLQSQGSESPVEPPLSRPTLPRPRPDPAALEDAGPEPASDGGSSGPSTDAGDGGALESAADASASPTGGADASAG